MPEFNPYTPPQIPSIPPPLPDGYTPDGVWRQGKLLVMHKQAILPDRCVKSNQPAEGRRLKRSMSWHHPAIFLAICAGILVYIILALVLSKRATIYIGLSEEWFARRRRAIIIGWIVVLASVGMFVTAGVYSDRLGEEIVAPLILAGVATFFAGAIYGLVAARMVAPTKITSEHIWIKGVQPEYLATLPECPMPG